MIPECVVDAIDGSVLAASVTAAPALVIGHRVAIYTFYTRPVSVTGLVTIRKLFRSRHDWKRRPIPATPPSPPSDSIAALRAPLKQLQAAPPTVL